MIGSVIGLFQVVSFYGDRYLQAPPTIDGRYLSTGSAPGCPESDRFVLTIQQSGIYLSGILSAEKQAAGTRALASAEERPPLFGMWQKGEISLSGTTDAFSFCNVGEQSASSAAATATSPVEVTVQGQINPQDNKRFMGQLLLKSRPEAWQFTAERQMTTQPQEAGH